MRLARSAAAVCLLAAAPARADDQLQAVVSSSTGATDNVLSAPEVPIDETMRPPEADLFITLSPCLLYSLRRPRDVHRISYLFDYTAYLSHSEANTYSNRLGWAAAFTTSPRTELQTSLGVTQGRVSSFDSRLPTGSDVNAGSGAPSTFVSVGGAADFSFQVTREWFYLQSVGLATMRPLDERPSTVDASLGTTAERAWRHDAASLGLRLGYTGTFQPPEDTVTADVHQLMSGLEGRWRHDIGGFWTSEFRLGLLALSNAEAPSQRNGPLLSGAATLGNVKPERSFSLTYSHDARANLFTGGSVLADEVALSGSLPLGWLRDQVTIGATAAYQRSRNVSFDAAADGPPTHVFRGQAVLSWNLRESAALMLSYDYVNQRTDQEANPLLVDFARHSVMLTIGAMFPSRAAAELPNRQALRVGGEDQTPSWGDGDEQEEPKDHRGEPKEGVGN